MRLARWAYNLGWGPKGWPAGNPLAAVPYWVQQSLLVMACADGLQINWVDEEDFVVVAAAEDWRARLDHWTQADYRRVPELDPMGVEPEHAANRLLSVLLERTLRSSDGLRVTGSGTFAVGNQEVTVTLEDLLASEIPLQVRKVAQRSRMDRNLGHEWEKWMTIAPASIRLWATAWLQKLEGYILEGTPRLRIRVYAEDPIPILALWDSLELLEAVRRLYGLSFRLPEVELEAPALSQIGKTALEAYLGGTNGRSGREALWPLIDGPAENPQIVIGDPVDLDDDELEAHWDEQEIATEAEQLLSEGHLGLPQDYRIEDTPREVLDHFFSRFLGHPSLRNEQVEAVQRLLKQESMLVILPTGYGKSAIYQLSALIQPGMALVIAPLVALIQDQIGHLHRCGIVGAGSITSREIQNPNEIYDLVMRGPFRLFYITPERLETEGFSGFITQLIDYRRLSFIAVDEAHCVSEWGHDFRTSYTLIKSLREYVENQYDGDERLRTPIVGLTATASSAVRGDILHTLGIDEADIVQNRSSDRPELSYSVHLAEGRDFNDRLRLLEELLTRIGPRILEMDGDGLLARTDGGEYRHGAVVFTPFADHYSHSLFSASAPVVGYHLQRHVWPTYEIGVYAGRAPRQCPSCRSPRVYHQGWGRWECTDCRHRFRKGDLITERRDHWQSRPMETQGRFLDDRLPVMVSTKGFGMGVDKPNIRFIVHYVMSGSLEGYYQEIGRAGRDGRHAHVALISVPPKRECAKEYIDNGRLWNLGPEEPIPLPCLEMDDGFPSLKCIYGLSELCDVAQQSSLISSNFPGMSVEKECLEQVYAKLIADVDQIKVDDNNWQKVATAIATLQELSVIKTYTRTGSAFKLHRAGDWSWERACDALERHLRFYETLTGGGGSGSQSQYERRMEELRRRRGSQDEFVRQGGSLLLEIRYTSIRAIRLYSLCNLYRYTTLPPGRCRRSFLRQTFEINPPREYQCGFCDTCVPSLSFERERAIQPEERLSERELARRLDEILSRSVFDFEAVKDFMKDAVEGEYVSAVRQRTGYIREQRPNDLNVLFLAALSIGLDGDEEESYLTLSRALDVARRQGVSCTDRLRYLFACREWFPDFPEKIVGQEGGPFDAPDEARQVQEALTQYAPELGKRLALSWALRDLIEICEEYVDALPAESIRRFIEVTESIGDGSGEDGRDSA